MGKADYGYPQVHVRAVGMDLPGLDIVIVNWNAGGLIADCLGSIVQSKLPGTG